MSNNSDMIKMLRLVEGQQFAGLPEQRPGDQVRGTERAKKNGQQHPFHNRLVGEEISLEDKLSKKYQDMKDLHGKDKDVAEEGSENKYSNLSNRGVNRGINRAADDFDRMMDLDQAESPHYKTQHQQDTKQRLKTKPMAGPKGVLPEGSQRVDSLVTDALRVMKGAEVSDAVSALKTVLGDREYNDRPGFYKFYIKQMLDMYGQQGIAESNMPQSVIKSKQKYAAMTAQEFHAAHKNKSAEELQAMAWRHGYGKGSNHYVAKHKKGSTVTEGRNEIATGTPDAIKVKIKELGLGPARRESTGSGGEAIFVFRNPNYYVSQGQDGNWVLVQTNAESDQQGVAEGSGDPEITPEMETPYGTVVKVNGNTVTVKASNGDLTTMNIHDIQQGVAEGQEEIEYTCSGCSGSGEGPHEGTTCRTCHGSGVEMGYADEPEHEHDEEELDEGWKDKLAAAALAGTMALGAAGAHARVVPGQDDPGINRLTGKPIATQVAPSDAKPELKAPTGYSKEYLQSVVDGTHPRPMVSVEKAQQLLGQMNEESDYGSNESPMERPMLHRIMMRHMDLIEKYGIDRVLDAVRDVAGGIHIGPDDEIGTSDVSAAMVNVMNQLKSSDHAIDENIPAGDINASGSPSTSSGPAPAVSAGGTAPTTPSSTAPAPAATTAPAPAGSTTPGQQQPMTPEEQAALDKIKSNAGLKAQYDKLIQQAH